jgi:anti-sigma regulatory factor (Ser/Thr protein kinase)
MTDGRVMRCELEADLAEVGTARRFVRANLSDVSDELNADAQLVASELVTNAVEHGTGGPVVVALSRDRAAVALTVESVGPAPEVGAVDEWEVAPVEQITGRGLGIVRSIADRVDVYRRDGRLVITASLAR